MPMNTDIKLTLYEDILHVSVFGHSWEYGFAWFNNADEIYKQTIEDIDKLIEMMDVVEDVKMIDGLYDKLIATITRLFTEHSNTIDTRIHAEKSKILYYSERI